LENWRFFFCVSKNLVKLIKFTIEKKKIPKHLGDAKVGGMKFSGFCCLWGFGCIHYLGLVGMKI
jgi:hypothetical protein